MQSRGVSFRHAVELLRNEHPSLADAGAHRLQGHDRGGEAGNAVRGERRRSARVAPGGRLLPRDAEAKSRGAEVPARPRPHASGDDRPLPHRLRQSHARATACRKRTARAARRSGAACRSSASCASRATSTSAGRWSFPCSTSPATSPEMYGRKITPGLREGTPLHLYLPGPHQGVWNELALQVSKEIILCEALIDALTFWCAGFRNVTASYGVGGFTDDHRAAFRKHGVQAGVDRLRPRRSRRKSGAVVIGRTAGDGHRVFPRAVSARHGRQRVRAAKRRRQPGFWKSRSTRRSGWARASRRRRLTVEVIPVAGEDPQQRKNQQLKKKRIAT